MLLLGHRRRINIEEKAKVVAATWGTKFIQFLAVPVILHYGTILKNRKNSSFSSNHPGAVHPILQIFLLQNSLRSMELMKYCPPNSSDDLCLFFCIYPSSMCEGSMKWLLRGTMW